MPVSGGVARILVVEDEPVINQAVTDRLRGSGYDVVQAWDGPGAVAQFGETAPDLVVLDVMLPGFDGHEVCRPIKAGAPVPVLMLTARDDEAKVRSASMWRRRLPDEALRLRELVARVAALLRRVDRAAELASLATTGTVELGDLRVDPAARRVWVAGAEVHLTPTEFDLLAAGLPHLSEQLAFGAARRPDCAAAAGRPGGTPPRARADLPGEQSPCRCPAGLRCGRRGSAGATVTALARAAPTGPRHATRWMSSRTELGAQAPPPRGRIPASSARWRATWASVGER